MNVDFSSMQCACSDGQKKTKITIALQNLVYALNTECHRHVISSFGVNAFGWTDRQTRPSVL